MRSLARVRRDDRQSRAGRTRSGEVGGPDRVDRVARGQQSFSQLYAALALRHFGRDLKTNPLWQSLSPEEQKAWRSLLNPERFYDPKTNRVINLPENYLGVAARIASIDYELGIPTIARFSTSCSIVLQCSSPAGNLLRDDAPPTGRYDRYSNEYARYIWEAAEMAGRKDILDKVRPSLKAQMRLWWDVVSEDGYGYNWGRSQGVVSYLDTPEIAGFLASHPEFRPAPLAISPRFIIRRGVICCTTIATMRTCFRSLLSDAETIPTFRASASGNRRPASSASSRTRTRRS
jgi:hypothetical protein